MLNVDIIDKKNPSVTEWLEKIGAKNVQKFRQEDNSKRDRLEILFQTIGLAYDRPTKLSADDIVKKTTHFEEVWDEWKDQKCALRLIPQQPDLPKLRVRGKTFRQNLNWFNGLKIDPALYQVEVVPHVDNTLYSSIFIVTKANIWGEIIRGSLWQLSEGLYEKNKPVRFDYDFQHWRWSQKKLQMSKIIKQATDKLLIHKRHTQNKLRRELKATFAQPGYLQGYFEFVVWPKIGIVFVDYNRLRPRAVKHVGLITHRPKSNELTGVCASSGQAIGAIRIVQKPSAPNFPPGEVLVCKMTNVDYLPLMRLASAIITEQGTVLSHPAVVSRELKKPCIIEVKNASTRLKTGDRVIVNASQGIVSIIK